MTSVKPITKKFVVMWAMIVVSLGVVISGCSSASGTGQNQDSDSVTVDRGEHDRDGGEGNGEHSESGEHNGGEHSEVNERGEESGTEYALNETYDVVRNGARLILAYDAGNNAFNGTVENTTEAALQRVRVEVHLSNGTELGPTTPVELAPGEIINVTLPATSQAFDRWNGHPEVGSGEGGGEHSEGGDEHG